MSKDIKVSVIVPVYNAEKYIKRCLDSILAQSYRYFEVLLIDDGSTDNSGKICDEYALNDNRIRVIHKENSGVSATRNIGITEAKGDYIAFVDSDDYIKSDMFEKMVKNAEKNNSDMVMCNYFTDKDGKVTKSEMSYKAVYDGTDDIRNGLLYLYYTDYHNGLYSLCNKLIKKSVYYENDILFDVSLKRGEDAWFVFECLKHCKRVDYISEAFYYYYQNQSSIMHSLYDDQYDQWVEIRKRLLNENQTLGFNIDYDLFYWEFFYKIAIYCKETVLAGKTENAKRIFKDEFYLQSVRYLGNLPIHIKIIHKSAKINPTLAIIELKLWNIFKGQ